MCKNQSTWGLWMTPLGNNFWRQCIIRYTIYYFDGVDDQKNDPKKIYNPLQISIYTLRNLHCWLLVYRFYNFAIIKIRTILQYTPHQQKKFITVDIKFSRKFVRTLNHIPKFLTMSEYILTQKIHLQCGKNNHKNQNCFYQ